MVDTLKALPFLSIDDYRWKYSIPYIKLMTIDNTRIHYLSDKEKEMKDAVVIDNVEDLMNDFGMPIDLTQPKEE